MSSAPALFVGAVFVLASAVVACGGRSDNTGGPGGAGASSIPPAVENNAGGTIPFTPSQVDASRTAHVCGVDPPFVSGDVYSVDIEGRRPDPLTGTSPPYASLVLTFTSPVSVGTPIALAVEPVSSNPVDLNPTPYPNQSATGGGISFSYQPGIAPSEIDPGAFDSVAATVVAMPLKEGESADHSHPNSFRRRADTRRDVLRGHRFDHESDLSSSRVISPQRWRARCASATQRSRDARRQDPREDASYRA
jgi:hypothetical protein